MMPTTSPSLISKLTFLSAQKGFLFKSNEIPTLSALTIGLSVMVVSVFSNCRFFFFLGVFGGTVSLYFLMISFGSPLSRTTPPSSQSRRSQFFLRSEDRRVGKRWQREERSI